MFTAGHSVFQVSRNGIVLSRQWETILIKYRHVSPSIQEYPGVLNYLVTRFVSFLRRCCGKYDRLITTSPPLALSYIGNFTHTYFWANLIPGFKSRVSWFLLGKHDYGRLYHKFNTPQMKYNLDSDHEEWSWGPEEETVVPASEREIESVRASVYAH